MATTIYYDALVSLRSCSHEDDGQTVCLVANIETSIKACCKACNACPVTAPAQQLLRVQAHLLPWPLPDEPWDLIHVDCSDPIIFLLLNDMWMLVMDAYSRSPSLLRMSNYPTTETTTIWSSILSSPCGIIQRLVNDYGPQFCLKQLQYWCRLNSIVHLTSAPISPVL